MTDRTVLLTLGRLPPAVDVARSFAHAGWRVIVAEPFGRHMAGTSRAVDRQFRVPPPVVDADAYLDALAAIIAREQVSLVVPVSEETMHVARLASRLDGRCDVFCSPATDTLALHSKARFVATAEAAGLPVPTTVQQDADAAAALVAGTDVIIKPEFSCSGRGITRLAQGSPLPALEADQIVQQCVHGDELSGFAIAQAGRIVVSAVYRAVVRHGSVAVVFERIDAPAVDDWMQRFVAHTGHTGFIAFDLIVTADGTVRAIECNPRATSGLHFVALDDLAPAITGELTEARLRDETLLQEFWSTWSHWFSALGDGDERRRTGRALRAARDVVWRRDDPWVFLLATWSTWPIIGQALRRGETFAEVLALDIEYRPQAGGLAP